MINDVSELQLVRVPHPTNEAKVLFFRRWVDAFAHLRDHLLSQPECLAWQLIHPTFDRVVDMEDDEHRFRLVQEAKNTNGGAAQAVYEEYAKAVTIEIVASRQLGWHTSLDGSTMSLGVRGVLIVFEPDVVTAFIPGQGDPAATMATHTLPRDTIRMVRNRPMLSGRQADRKNEGRDRRQATHIEARWTPEQRCYYKVFRPAVQFVRSRYHRAYTYMRRHQRAHYGILKDVLPRMSQLTYDGWQDYCQRCEVRDQSDE